MNDPLPPLSDAELLARLPAAAALPDAPADWQRRALAAWRAPAGLSLAQAVDALRQRVLAVLSFDSWAQSPLAAGLRSTGSATRQLVFSAEGRDIDLRISPAGECFTVTGQVLGPDDNGAVALASEQPPATVYEAPLDALGEFRLADVAPGRYQLSLLLAGHEIVLPPFEVGHLPKDGRAG
ncbi:MAG TPA: carboxypeptidase-like regulatory domain-containing protein [Ideonella sp.]|uniref:carboxypeptidase-like regulatory domain-containing protein n=1 Tax=Ideonella sp. TaxID=1929293 RepID=UPI002E2FDCAD|nr:carboxypeptidase-like regulatory domain-containing protein [Ideonella sp.]HEX5688125.1 carboxypeptidase-like regulatory domain-containing protein [Ideonella sp.]